jgi:hypothetical protein
MFPEGIHDYPMAAWFTDLAFRALGSKYSSWAHGTRSPGITITNPFFKR